MTEATGRLTAYEVLTAPVTVLVGHFGSGKSEIAVNLAFGWQARGQQVSVIDLDLVKPYFRSRLLREDMQARGIVARGARRTTASTRICRFWCRRLGARSARPSPRTGGSSWTWAGPTWARACWAPCPGLSDPALTDVLFVVNGNRPFAETPAAVIAMLRDIERVSTPPGDGPGGQHAPDGRDRRRPSSPPGCRWRTRSRAGTGIPVRFCGHARPPRRRPRRHAEPSRPAVAAADSPDHPAAGTSAARQSPAVECRVREEPSVPTPIIDADRCKGCELCVFACPERVLEDVR